ncbi:MAG: hypothetical protein Q9222_004519 [Ikaeria aurantiellina]
MPQAKPKPADIATEAKRIFFSQAEKSYPSLSIASKSYPDTSNIRLTPGVIHKLKLRIAVIDGDPLDVALDWHDYNQHSGTQAMQRPDHRHAGIPVVNMANEKRAGGDWESGLMAPEENLCRRTNLVQALRTPQDPRASHYPIPTPGGLYSPHVVAFRSGPEEGYAPWSRFKVLPVISVAPIRRPKLDESGEDYSFTAEKEMMKQKMRSVLRIAAREQHYDLCMGAFGVGPGFRNPASQVASIWRTLLFDEPEFQGVFSNVVFAIESGSESSSKDGLSDHDIFKKEFDPSNIVKTSYRQAVKGK